MRALMAVQRIKERRNLTSALNREPPRRLLNKYRDHREGVLRDPSAVRLGARSRRVAESDAVASVKRPNEDPGPQPPFSLRVGAARSPLGRWRPST